MLQVQIDVLDYLTTYNCPYCGANDIHHISTYKICYSCTKTNEFDIEDLLNLQKERVNFHKSGKTTNGWQIKARDKR